MGANLNKIIIVDVEATCWETEAEQNGQRNEIIEIGCAVLNLKTREITNKQSISVKPRSAKVSQFCTDLTGWTQEQVDKGLDIEDALVSFKQLLTPKSGQVWASFGEYDRYMLSSMTGKAGLWEKYLIPAERNPFDQMRSHMNAKTYMALKHSLPRELGLKKALAYYGIEFEGRHHNGADDAFNIAKIVDKVLS